VKAYEKAVLIDANCAALYYDLAINRYFHALVLDTHLPDTDAKESGAWAIRRRSASISVGPQNADEPGEHEQTRSWAKRCRG
jgi:hypothetical protein